MTVYDDLDTIPEDAILVVDPGVCPPFLRKGMVHVCSGRFSYMAFMAWFSRDALDPDNTGPCCFCGKMLPLWNTHGPEGE